LKATANNKKSSEKNMKKIFGLALVAGIIISSCNLPAAGTPDPQIVTAAALTVQAAINSSSNTQPLASPTTVSVAAATTATPTYSKPFISVGDVTNCRTGPGVNYERVTQILPSDSVEIIGFFPPNYWIVSSSAGNCWVSGEFATDEANITILWTDKDGESGYRVLRNSEKVAELPENSAQFNETITLLSGQSVGYNIVAFNAIGSTSSSTVTLTC
jgi:uncharacterized protein YgiM (DUF1202 family)